MKAEENVAQFNQRLYLLIRKGEEWNVIPFGTFRFTSIQGCTMLNIWNGAASQSLDLFDQKWKLEQRVERTHVASLS